MRAIKILAFLRAIKILAFLLLVVGILFALGITLGHAQTQCNSRDVVISLLANKYKESPVAVGITNTGGLVEVLSTGDGNTWTIIVTTPQGMSCLVSAGEGWRQIEQEDPRKEPKI